jgi:hypothetical protein
MKAYPVTPVHEARVRPRSWGEAYRLFLMNPRESLGVKVLPLVALGVVPISMASDVLLPVIGLADNIPTAILVMFAALRTWQRVRTYR